MKNNFVKLSMLITVSMLLEIICACSRASLPSIGKSYKDGHKQTNQNGRISSREDQSLSKNILNGKWMSECRSDKGKSERYSYEFSESTYAYVRTVFAGAGCDVFTAQYETKIYGQVIVGDMVDGADYRIIDYGVDRVNLKPLSQPVQTQFAKNRKCDILNWKIGVDQDVTNFSCQLEVVNETTLVMYNIVKMSDQPNIQGKFTLWFGETTGTYNGSVPSLRPRVLASYIFMN